MKKCVLVLIFVLFAAPAFTQQAPIATINSKLYWSQAAQDLATSQSYIYKYYPDGSATGNQLNAVTCTGTVSPFTCEVAFPLFNQGNHTLKLSAQNAAGEGDLSSPFAFSFVGKPSAPINIGIK